MSDAFLRVENLARRFPGGQGGAPFTVFAQVNFTLRRGEFVCMIGHSGCGKSTILGILAGLDTPSEGAVIMDGKEVVGPSLDRGVIFQNHSLLPWQSALKNVTFAVQARWRDWSREQVLAHSRRYLELVGLAGAESRRPAELSGGMRQRVGIARAFAIQPKLLLMDEPFGALDALTRGTIQEELVRIWEQSGQTVFMITHDVDEAILLADRIVLMTNGPDARIAEIVEVTLPRPRERARLIHEPAYYAIRNHLVEFLVKRSRTLREHPPPGYDPKHPPVVRPGLDAAALAEAAVVARTASRH
ncbi:MAG TPA: ABC transporter ATP-binding protein [Burkholderiales bacterium]